MRKTAFSEAEWSVVREAPHWAGLAAMTAEISSRGEDHATDAHIRHQVLSSESKDPSAWIHEEALRQAREARAILERVSPSDLAEYSAWVVAIAERVANAAKEGAILGFGGTRIGEKEQRFLAELREALGLA